jgi:hypothetical protein
MMRARLAMTMVLVSAARAAVAGPQAKPASPAKLHRKPVAICPQLDLLRPWWKHEAFPGCPAMPFVFFGSLNDHAGGICAAGTDCGRPCSVSYDAFSGSISWSLQLRYDPRGRWTGIPDPDGHSLYGAVACSYDGERLASCTQTDSDGKPQANLVARRDPTGRLIAIEDPGGAIGDPWTLTLTYNAHGDVSVEQLTSNRARTRVIYDHDAASHRLVGERRDDLMPRPRGSKPAPVAHVKYAYDADGVLIGRTSENLNGGPDRTTYRFADGVLVESQYRAHSTPHEVERASARYDDHGRPRQLDWFVSVNGERHDERDRSVSYHYADDPDSADVCKP